MTTTHTPGPWILDTPELIHASAPGNGLPYYSYSILTPSGQTRIAEVFGNQANANLIASAPELEETLERIEVIAYAQVDGKKGDMREALLECIRQARAAIAKAEGRNL